MSTVAVAAAEHVVRREFPDAEVRSVREAAGGRKATFIVELAEESIAVSICTVEAFEPRFQLEPAVMGLVAEHTDVPVPEVLATDFSKREVPYMYHVTRYVEGETLATRYSDLPMDAKARVLRQAGRQLGALHAGLSFERFGDLVWDPEPAPGALRVDPDPSWGAFLGRRMREWIDELEDGRFDDLVPTFEAVRERRERYLATDGDDAFEYEPVLLHFDYRPANLVCRNREIAAVLDWEFAAAGHAEYDVFKFEKNFLLAYIDDPAEREALRPHLYAGYRERHELDPGWAGRRTFYRVAHKLESLAAFDRWTAGMDERGRDRMAATLRRELADLLGELENGWDGDRDQTV